MDNLLARLEFTNTAIEAGLFHDTGVLPAQFYPGHRDVAPTEPIKKLMTATLVDAVPVLPSGTTADRERNRSAGGQRLDLRQLYRVPFLVHQRMHRTGTLARPEKAAVARWR